MATFLACYTGDTISSARLIADVTAQVVARAMRSRRKPSVTRIAAPDEEAKAAALKLLIERTVATSKRTPPDERHSTNR